VQALLVSPAANSLFHAAISMSGSFNMTMDRQTKYAQDEETYMPGSPCSTF